MSASGSQLLVNPDQWKVSKLREKPGLIIIKNPFTSAGQRYWVEQLLKNYTHDNPNNLLPSKFEENEIRDFWKSLNEEPSKQRRRLLKKSMRWSTLGYHYDWTNKIYDESRRSEFPPELSNLVSFFADALGFEGFRAEAAIINFYPVGTTLSSHTDHSELFLDSPLFSISFGQNAIFLLGGTEKSEEVFPILVASGDVIVMSGESRLCYHAVPRVFCTNAKPWSLSEENSDWKPFDDYLADSRINVNIRQVKK